MNRSQMRMLPGLLGLATTLGLLTSSTAFAAPELAVLPEHIGQSAAYVFDFSADYGGYNERYHGLLNLKQIAQGSVLVSGSNNRVTLDEISHLGVKREVENTPAFVAPRTGEFSTVLVSDTRSGVADQVFDYNELLTLLDSRYDSAGTSSWLATTTCWISNTVVAPVRVRVTVRERGGSGVLTASGARRIQVGEPSNPIVADINVALRANFRDGVLTDAALQARELFERHGIPAGGGVYHWTVNLKGRSK